MYGADVFRIDHDSPADIFDLLQWACDEFGWHLVSTAAIYNPFTLEGAKTIAYEIAEQTAFDLPGLDDRPRGRRRQHRQRLARLPRPSTRSASLDRLPRMVGVQAAGCAPFVDAIRLDRTAREALATRWPAIDTVAGAIADDVVFDAHVALPAVRESGGTAVAVNDERDPGDGTDARGDSKACSSSRRRPPPWPPSSVLLADGRFRDGDRVLCLMTGHGLKDPASASRLVSPVVTIPLERAAFAARA